MSVPARAEQGNTLERSRYTFWARELLFPSFFIVLLGLFDLRPVLTGNEAVRLIPGVILSDPSAFAGDWSFHSLDPSALLFDRLVAVLLRVFSPIALVLIGRVVAWGAILYFLWTAAKILGISTDALFAGLCAWFLLGQSTIAGEWVFAGFEPKVFSYGLLLAALVANLRRRPVAGGVFLALAYLCHPFVGLWGGGSLLLALLTGRPRGKILPAALGFIMPSLFFAVLFLLNRSSADENLRLYVYFRNAHHLDPGTFGTRGRILTSLVALSVVTIWRDRRDSLNLPERWILFLNVAFGAGLTAWALNFTPILATYPFRIAPVVNLLAACILLAGRALNPARAAWKSWRGAIALALVLLYLLQFNPATQLRKFRRNWSNYLAGTDFSRRPLVSWAHANTSSDSIFLLPPNDPALWFYSRRPQYVSLKYHPPRAMREWMNRLVRINRGKALGVSVRKELDYNYSRLDIDELLRLRHDAGVRFYVAPRARADLSGAEVYRDPPYFVYDLARLEQNPAGRAP